ncbi:hypothetical protein [Phenylobacterium sp.]|uniref:hypothetical protein n=1 Tax=Phenylobacterium sp. TaxID=1871053 RepID=UPI002CDF8BFE|nr:hypothetical protein [Phenylobacterium sp.]HVI34400.1 hypothetical protein [Phenylobacterium sp.]
MRAGRCVAALAGLVLAACGPAAQAPATPETPEPKAAAPVAVAEPRWSLETPAAGGAALVHADAGGREVLRVGCRPDRRELQAAVPGIARIGSEDRLTLGAGTELAVFVVSMAGPDQGLRATGQPQPGFVEGLAEGREVGVSYGARQLTLPGAPRDVAAAFAARCGGGR